MRYIVKGKIIDHDDNDREYVLKGVKARGKDNGMVVCGGSGYCLEIREDEGARFVLTLVTEETLKGSVYIKTYLSAEAILKNFTYIGDEEV
jgi:hypothetical protein